ncbi:unnamed protein product [Amoebophrya sp. A25]|nr:unnamed protein product [Amoebophrya sp. A25]|eukprot:GSA25T00017316001.1
MTNEDSFLKQVFDGLHTYTTRNAIVVGAGAHSSVTGMRRLPRRDIKSAGDAAEFGEYMGALFMDDLSGLSARDVESLENDCHTKYNGDEVASFSFKMVLRLDPSHFNGEATEIAIDFFLPSCHGRRQRQEVFRMSLYRQFGGGGQELKQDVAFSSFRPSEYGFTGVHRHFSLRICRGKKNLFQSAPGSFMQTITTPSQNNVNYASLSAYKNVPSSVYNINPLVVLASGGIILGAFLFCSKCARRTASQWLRNERAREQSNSASSNEATYGAMERGEASSDVKDDKIIKM